MSWQGLPGSGKTGKMMGQYSANLKDCPFAYESNKSGSVRIFYNNKPVTVLKGQTATKSIHKMLSLDEGDRQIQMAKATGHFKHGNEKSSQR